VRFRYTDIRPLTGGLAARPRPGLMLGFFGFPHQLIVPAAAKLAALVNRGRSP
jgi:hypothetical protein